MTDLYPRHKPLPKGATWERPKNEDYEGRPGTYGPVYDLPSPEKMRLEIETGEFSPESLAIADSILESVQDKKISAGIANEATERALRDPENDEWQDWWAEQEYFGAPQEREKSFIEKQTDDIMKRVTAAPLPSAAHFKKLSLEGEKLYKEAKKSTKAFKRLAREMPKPRVGANLQYRPFLILSTLRDDLTK